MKKIILLLSLLVIGSYAIEIEENKSIKNITQDSRNLLIEEMAYVEQGMKDIFSSLIRNDLVEVEKTASIIENSYVFAKKITKETQKDLMANVPKGFFLLDVEFHELAGKLARAAEFEDRKEALDTYNELTKKCIQCHSTYVKHRFTSF